MSLRRVAERDLGFILESHEEGFRWELSLTPPSGAPVPMFGFSNDIAQVIDPDTGQLVSGRLATVALRISTLNELGIALPTGVADQSKRPWLVTFDDINGKPGRFKVRQADPDRALGLVVCFLEVYR